MFGTAAGSEEEEAVWLDEEYIRPRLLESFCFFFPSYAVFFFVRCQKQKRSHLILRIKSKAGGSVCFNLAFT